MRLFGNTNMKSIRLKLAAAIATTVMVGCSTSSNEAPSSVNLVQPAQAANFDVEFDRFTLDNGLKVIFHVDRSDPVVAVALTSHVGSARELPGRTGFAHLFEHLLFLESENLGKGGLDKMSTRIGGSGANGSTSRDRTNYYQTVPNDALEKMIWAEADKLGFFINTVTEQVLTKEKQVVKNEKRQSGDNRPYGHTGYVIDKNLYPPGHPYSWQVIGSLEDLQNATLQDVKDFFNQWYVPNNVSLTIAGDFDVKQAKMWVKKYFNEIKRGETITNLPKQAAVLKHSKKLYHEDNFARVPELTLTWPTVYRYHPDAYPLEVLKELLSSGKTAPFNQVLTDEQKLSSTIGMYNRTSELSGQFSIAVRAFADTPLDNVELAINAAFVRFESNGVGEHALNRIKTSQETSFYNSISSVLGKAFQLAQYDIFAGDPAYINQDVKNILAVNKADVMRVYRQYIKNKPFVATSFVPKGKVALALSNSSKAQIDEEKIVNNAEQGFKLTDKISYVKTPSTFDRSSEPAYGKELVTKIPNVWDQKLSNGLRVLGVKDVESPMVRFSLVIKGGLQLDDINKVGVANLVSSMMLKGTAGKSTAQLEEAIKDLGATINVRASREKITISGNTLARNYDKTMALVEDIVLNPRWDENEFELARQSVLSNIAQQAANPNAIATNLYNGLIYGQKHILSKDLLGTKDSVNAITLSNLKHFYQRNVVPSLSSFHIVGAVGQDKVLKSLTSLAEHWQDKPVTFTEYPLPEPLDKPQVYFYDIPDAKQSMLRFGYLAMAATDKDFYPATIMNYILGGGSFASQLTQQLREGKGYTYGIRSRFNGTTNPGPFVIASSVRSNVTFESAALVRKIVTDYPDVFSENDHIVTQNFLLKSNARAFETLASKLSLLENISRYSRPVDYVLQQEKLVKEMTLQEISSLATRYLDVSKMMFLVVGDAKTQLKRLEDLGFGKPILLK
jgi:zinc protease